MMQEAIQKWVCDPPAWAITRGFQSTRDRSSGLGLLTPKVAHTQRAEAVRNLRQHTLDIAYAAHPERFVRKPPQALRAANGGLDKSATEV